MTQKLIKIFIDENYSKAPKNIYATNKTDIYHIDDIWYLDIFDLKDYALENIRGYRYVLVVINNFLNFCWTTPLKNKNAITITTSFENILIYSKRKPNLIEINRGKEFYKEFSRNFLK